jgi:ribosomal protein S18 acetylase RimI-like enzyme
VGTHPDHARRGLARAVCTAAIRRAGELGARWVIVYARADDVYSAPKRLYESMGFRQVARVLELQLERG